MSDDNNAKNIQYLEIDEQRSFNDSYDGGSNDLYGNYLSKEISLFGKLFIFFMLSVFILSVLFLVFSYTTYGVDFLREMKIKII